jgi:hypothetical protein
MVRECRPPARDPRQRQFARQHQPCRAASSDHHRMLHLVTPFRGFGRTTGDCAARPGACRKPHGAPHNGSGEEREPSPHETPARLTFSRGASPTGWLAHRLVVADRPRASHSARWRVSPIALHAHRPAHRYRVCLVGRPRGGRDRNRSRRHPGPPRRTQASAATLGHACRPAGKGDRSRSRAVRGRRLKGWKETLVARQGPIRSGDIPEHSPMHPGATPGLSVQRRVNARLLRAHFVAPTPTSTTPAGTKMKVVHQTARPTLIASAPTTSHRHATLTPLR